MSKKICFQKKNQQFSLKNLFFNPKKYHIQKIDQTIFAKNLTKRKNMYF